MQGRQHGDEVFSRHQEQHQAPVSTGRRRRIPAELHRSACRTDPRHRAERVLPAVAVHRVLSQRRSVTSYEPLCLVDRRRCRSDSRLPSRRRRSIAFDGPSLRLTSLLRSSRVLSSSVGRNANVKAKGRTTLVCEPTAKSLYRFSGNQSVAYLGASIVRG